MSSNHRVSARAVMSACEIGSGPVPDGNDRVPYNDHDWILDTTNITDGNQPKTMIFL